MYDKAKTASQVIWDLFTMKIYRSQRSYSLSHKGTEAIPCNIYFWNLSESLTIILNLSPTAQNILGDYAFCLNGMLVT